MSNREVRSPADEPCRCRRRLGGDVSEEAAAARAKEVPQWEALFGELGPSGALGAGYELDSPKTARTVRVRDGETLVTDGPFADTRSRSAG